MTSLTDQKAIEDFEAETLATVNQYFSAPIDASPPDLQPLRDLHNDLPDHYALNDSKARQAKLVLAADETEIAPAFHCLAKQFPLNELNQKVHDAFEYEANWMDYNDDDFYAPLDPLRRRLAAADHLANLQEKAVVLVNDYAETGNASPGNVRDMRFTLYSIHGAVPPALSELCESCQAYLDAIDDKQRAETSGPLLDRIATQLPKNQLHDRWAQQQSDIAERGDVVSGGLILEQDHEHER